MDATICGRCGEPLELSDTDAPRFLHPSGEAICLVDNEVGEQDSGEPILATTNAE